MAGQTPTTTPSKTSGLSVGQPTTNTTTATIPAVPSAAPAAVPPPVVTLPATTNSAIPSAPAAIAPPVVSATSAVATNGTIPPASNPGTKVAVDAISALGGATTAKQEQISEELRAEHQAAVTASLSAPEKDTPPTWESSAGYSALNTSDSEPSTENRVFTWHPRRSHASGNNSGISSSNGKSTSGYTGLKLENTNLLNVSPLTDGIIKVGSVVIFGRGAQSAANHAAMCIGFDPTTHKPIWVSDAVQDKATVNARSRNGEYTIYDPPAGFNASKAAQYIRALAKIRTDQFRNVIGTKKETEFTRLCWQHVSMAISYGLGRSIGSASRASIAHGALREAGFTAVAGGKRGMELDIRTTQLAARNTRGSPANNA